MKLIGIPGSRGTTPAWLWTLVLGAACCAAPPDEPALAGAAAEAVVSASAPAIDVTRSLAVSDVQTLEANDASGQPRFSLYRVLTQIATTGLVGHHVKADELYARIWDTNNTKARGVVPDGQHCDDEKDASGKPTLNGFPIECPRQEAALADHANHHPFCTGDGCDPYSPIAITNRFDLAPSNGQTCGQYRIVFGKGVGQTPLATLGNQHTLNRALLIFEAVLPNPYPSRGLPGCAPVVDFWVALSSQKDPAKRAAALDTFFFTGLPGFAPVVKFDNYMGTVDAHSGVQLSGQIRANVLGIELGAADPDVGPQPWQLREYNLLRTCTGAGAMQRCWQQVKMVPPKLNPDATLFDDHNTSAVARAFRDPTNASGFLGQVGELAKSDVNLLNMNALSPTFNGAQSTSSPAFGDPVPVINDSNYGNFFNPQGAFAHSIQARLTQLGSKLTPLQIVQRAQTQSCAGCHELSTSTASFFGGMDQANAIGDSLTWPDDAVAVPPPGFPPTPIPAFTQTSDQILTSLVDGTPCTAACVAHPATCQCAWELSDALTRVFLPARRANMQMFLTKVHGGTWGTHDAAAWWVKGCPDN